MTKEQLAAFKTALTTARQQYQRVEYRLHQIEEETRALSREGGQLKRTITALAALCSESPGLDALGITDAVMEVMGVTPVDLSTSDVMINLERLGFDLASQKNAQASVHAVLTRLAQQKKIEKIMKNEKVSWRGPKHDPHLVADDDIPF